MRRRKIMNEYAEMIGSDLYRRAPKAVVAAIAVSVLTQGGDYLEDARQRFLAEWDALHAAGIVPQAPPKSARLEET